MRIGLIGAGYMGRQHADALSRMPGVEIVAVAGAEEGSARAAGLARERGLEAAVTVPALLGEQSVDAVVITTPTATHRDLVVAALGAGKHVLCETPLAQTSGDALAMSLHAESASVHLQVALLGRFADPGPWARGQICAGTVGAPSQVRVSRLAPGTSGAHHGDAIEEIMLFELDWLRWTFGDASVEGARVERDSGGRIDHAVAKLAFPAEGHSIEATVTASYRQPAGTPLIVSVEAQGEGGALRGLIELAAHQPPSVRRELCPRGGPPVVRTALGPPPITAEDAHAIHVFRGVADPALLHPREAVAALELSERIRAAANAVGGADC